MGAAAAAARIGDPIGHSSALMGFLIGAAVGLAAGVAIVAATVATGGAALAVVAAVGGGMATTGGLALFGEALGQTFTSSTGSITAVGSQNVHINRIPAARAITDTALCCKDGPAPIPIAQGSKRVRINSLPAARKGDSLVCGSKISNGSSNVRIGAEPGTFLAIQSEVPGWMHELAQGLVVVGSAVAIGFGAAAAFVGGGLCALITFGGELLGGLVGGVLGGKIGGVIGKAVGGERGELIGEFVGGLIGGFFGAKVGGRMSAGHPVDVATGELFTLQTDFRVNGPLPLVWERLWISNSSINGALGHGWHHTYDMALAYAEDTGYYVVRLSDGRLALFTPPAPELPSLNTVEQMVLHTNGKFFWLTSYDGIAYEFSDPATDGLRHLMRVVDPNNNNIRLERNESGYLFAIIDSADRLFEVEHDDAGRILAIHGPHPYHSGEKMQFVRYEYDEAGDLIESRDARGSALLYRYSNHLLTEERRRGGLLFHFIWDDVENGRRARCVDTWGNPLNGGEQLFRARLQYDVEEHSTIVTTGRGAVTQYLWNALGLVERETDPLGEVSVRQYDDAGRLMSLIRPDGAAETSVYDEFGRLIERTNAAGESTRFQYGSQDLDAIGLANPSRITGPNGATHTFVYGRRGNLLSYTDPLGSERRFKRNERGLPVEITDGEGVLRRLDWSPSGELLREAADDGEYFRYAWDGLSRMREFAPGGDAPTRFSRDGNDNVTAIHRPDGGTITLEYDAEDRAVVHRDALGRETRWRYDGLRFPVERIAADGSRFVYSYDSELNLVALENPKGEHYRLQYDLADRLVQEIGFDGRILEYDFNAAGHLLEKRDAGRPTRFLRDPVGRLLEKQFADGTAGRFQWDKAGNLVVAENLERKVEFAYDLGGRISLESQNGQALRHRYDQRGRRIETVLPDGRNVEIGYRGGFQFTSVSFNGSLVTTLERDAAGREVHRDTGGVQQAQSYDPQGRLVTQRGIKGRSETVFARNYIYDVTDAIKQIDDVRRGLKRYQYDACDRLLAVDSANPEAFVFDPAGNLLSTGTGLGEVKGDRLLSLGDRTFTYDEHGNRVGEFQARSGKQTNYRYDFENNLVEVFERGKRITRFGYDALGRRCWKATAEIGKTGVASSWKRTEFLWNGDVLASESGDADAQLATIYLFEPQSFRPLVQVRGSSVYHYHLDHLGTPQEMTDSAGETVWAADLKGWGTVRVKYVGKIDNPLRFQGQYADKETGLQYNGFRYYDPTSAAYFSPDPIGLLGSVRAYGYVHNPLSRVDPWGLAPVTGQGAPSSADPSTINFSQRTVGPEVNQYTEGMKSGNWDWSRSGPIRVMDQNGQLVSYDNRRLMAAQNAPLESVPIEKVNPDDIMPGSKKTWAKAFNERFNDPRNVKAGGPVPDEGLKDQPIVKCG